MNWKGVFVAMVVVGLFFTAAVQGQIPEPNDPNMTLLLWLKADAGVMAASNSEDPNLVAAGLGDAVLLWKDQSMSGNDATRVKGTMQLATKTFVTGEQNVVRFSKDGFFKLNTAPFQVPDLTVFAVVEQTLAERRVYFSTYSNAVNWGYGVNLDMEGSGTRAFTSAGSQETISDWWIAGPGPGMHMITTTISSTLGSKSIFVDGTLLGGPVAVPGISYYSTETASVGTLGQLDIDYFFFRGDIAELIVYNAVDATLRSTVEEYLIRKYGFVPMCPDWGYFQQDLNQDCYVNLADFAIFVQAWLECTDPQGEGCVNLINP